MILPLVAPARAVAVFSCLLLVMTVLAGKTYAGDLKGYSIDFTAVTFYTWRDLSSARPAGDWTTHWSLYFGRSGEVFVYRQAGGGQHVFRDKMVVSPGKAVTLGPARMVAVDIAGDKVTLIVKQTEGFYLHTLTVDPGRTACSYTGSIQPDPVTGRMISMKPDGITSQILTAEVKSSTCVVKPGNIFADDQ